MITEKGLRDFSWCPVLLTDEDGNKKRFKSDQFFEDDTLDLIYEALTQGKSNKKLYVTNELLGATAEPFQDGLWLRIMAGDTQLLLVVHKLLLYKKPAGPWQMEVRRNQRGRKPDSEDLLQMETYVQAFLFETFRDLFPQAQVSIQSFYEGDPEPLLTNSTMEGFLDQAKDHFQLILDTHYDQVPSTPNLDRCPNCWFRTKCTRAAQLPKLNPLGRSEREIL